MTPKIVRLVEVSDQEEEVLIPPGTYNFKLLNHETKVCFQTKRLILMLSICTLGEHFEKRLKRYYNIQDFIGKRGKKGRFYPKPRGDFLLDYYKLFPGRISRLDRVPMEPMYRNILIGRVATVTKNNQGKSLPVEMQYSKVAELIGVEK